METLTAEVRTIFGKQLAPYRQVGKLPVVAYGGKSEAKPLFLSIKEFKKVFANAGESSIVSVAMPEGIKEVLIHGVDFHPVTGEPIHADLLLVDMNKPIRVSVPLEFTGESPAVKDLGGALIKVLHEIEIEALPKNLPHNLIIDISSLVALDSQILVKEVVLPAGVTLISELEGVVASITTAGEEIKEEEEPVDLSAIEVEQKGKKDEEEIGIPDAIPTAE
ncbi:MAG: 50S ribosomal protein L25 [Candidatus Vogelbacteria bacterium]|nr:50S ribosomal protein L25 [Candidatus Vogelbacteria bacterium]